MKIDDRFRGDTNPLVMHLYEVVDKKDRPLNIPSDVQKIVFHFKGEDGVLHSIEGVNGTSDGKIEFPFSENTADAGDYVYDVEVTYNTGEKVTFVKDVMTIQEDVG